MTPAALRAWRKARGLTQTEFGRILADAAGHAKPYATATISRWEHGKQAIPETLAVHVPLADVLERLDKEGAR